MPRVVFICLRLLRVGKLFPKHFSPLLKVLFQVRNRFFPPPAMRISVGPVGNVKYVCGSVTLPGKLVSNHTLKHVSLRLTQVSCVCFEIVERFKLTKSKLES